MGVEVIASRGELMPEGPDVITLF